MLNHSILSVTKLKSTINKRKTDVVVPESTARVQKKWEGLSSKVRGKEVNDERNKKTKRGEVQK